MRFELINLFTAGKTPTWQTQFFHGTSKEIHRTLPDESLIPYANSELLEGWLREVTKAVRERNAKLPDNPKHLQQVWTRQAEGDGPFDVVDALGELAASALAELNDLEVEPEHVRQVLGRVFDVDVSVTRPARSMRKVLISAKPVLAGLAVCSAFNMTSSLNGNARTHR